MKRIFMGLVVSFMTLSPALASDNLSRSLNFQHSLYSDLSLSIFCFAYILVLIEEKLHLRKSKPVEGIINPLVDCINAEHATCTYARKDVETYQKNPLKTTYRQLNSQDLNVYFAVEV